MSIHFFYSKSRKEDLHRYENDYEPCVCWRTKSGYKTRLDASSHMSADQIADVALSLEYVKQYVASHKDSNYKQFYLLEQCVVWQRLSMN